MGIERVKRIMIKRFTRAGKWIGITIRFTENKITSQMAGKIVSHDTCSIEIEN